MKQNPRDVIRRIALSCGFLVGGLVIGLWVQSGFAAWSDPPLAPPGGNLPAAVRIGPSVAQSDSTANPSIFVSDTGGGNLLQLRDSATDRFVIEKDGDVGIGITPGAKFDVNGTLRLGASGAVFTGIKSQIFAWNPPSTGAGATSVTAVTLSENGVVLGIALPNTSTVGTYYSVYNNISGVTAMNVYKTNSGNSQVDFAFRNTTAAAVDPPSANFTVYYMLP